MIATSALGTSLPRFGEGPGVGSWKCTEGEEWGDDRKAGGMGRTFLVPVSKRVLDWGGCASVNNFRICSSLFCMLASSTARLVDDPMGN